MTGLLDLHEEFQEALEHELISDFDLLPAAIWVMVALTAFTVLQRVWHVRGELRALDEQT